MRKDMRLELQDVGCDLELAAVEVAVQCLLEGSCDLDGFLQLFDCMAPYEGYVVETCGSDNRRSSRVVLGRHGWRS